MSYFTKMRKGHEVISAEHDGPATAARWTLDRMAEGYDLVGGKTTPEMRERQKKHFEQVIRDTETK